jgi:hypothetical protein
MATRCEDVTARMLELLYGELPAGDRATLQAHVDGCPRCKAELAAFTETRALARQVLDEPPPARVRAAILQAAAAHAAAAKPEVALAAAPAQAKPRAKESQPSFWERLRARWALPTLATVGAIAVFLIASKFLLEPNKAYNRGREAMAPAETHQEAAPAPSPALAPAPAEAPPDEAARRRAVPPVSQSASRSDAKAAAEKDVDDRKLRPATIDDSLGALKAEKKPAHAAAKGHLAAPSGGAAVGNLGSLATGKGSGVGASGALDGLMDGARGRPPGQFAPPPPPRPSADRHKGKANVADEPDFAPPPTAAAAPAPARKPAKRDISEETLEGFGGPAAASRRGGDEAEMAAEGEAPAEQPVRAKSKRGNEADDKAVAKKSEAPAAAPEATAASAPRSASAPADPLVQRADRLFGQGQWAEAAAAYRQLINRDPRNADAPRWRQRLVAAERENDAAVAARAAAAKAPAKAAKAPAKAAPASAAPPER